MVYRVRARDGFPMNSSAKRREYRKKYGWTPKQFKKITRGARRYAKTPEPKRRRGLFSWF